MQSENHCSELLAACDVLVLRALELVGKRIVRKDRSRYLRLNGRPWHEAHCMWQCDTQTMETALSGAWTFLPHIVQTYTCGTVTVAQLQTVLDRYLRELIYSQRGHSREDMAYRMGAWI